MKRGQITQALGSTAIIVGGAWVGMTVWDHIQGTPAEGPAVLASALLFASIILWGRKANRNNQPPASKDPDGNQEKGKAK